MKILNASRMLCECRDMLSHQHDGSNVRQRVNARLETLLSIRDEDAPVFD